MEQAKVAAIVVNRRAKAVDKIWDYAIPASLLGQVRRGSLVRVPFHHTKSLEGIVVKLKPHSEGDFVLKDIIELIDEEPLFSDQLLEVARFMADYYLCPYVTALQAMLPAGLSLTGRLRKSVFYKYYTWQKSIEKLTVKQQQVVDFVQKYGEVSTAELKAAGLSLDVTKRLVTKGVLKEEEREAVDNEESFSTVPTVLNEHQQAALEGIFQEMTEKKRPFLLHGVTGSGKTEIYLQLIKEVAATGKQSLLLVPEIAISTQILDFLHKRLQLPVALLHSGLTNKERRESWQKIAEGKYPVVVGARSAVFAPLRKLGLIVVDEEQETSYKQDNSPRFHAVTIAKERCRLEGAQLVLGSATPSVESYFATQTGDYALAKLPQRYFSAPLPQVQIVDMREELKQGNSSMISAPLQQKIRITLEQNRQIILFLNRRGYYTFYSCRHCGEAVRCLHCALPMSYHQKEGRLKCHYCGAMQVPPSVCPTCGSKAIRYFGSGTQRVVDEVQKIFPGTKVARLDRDAVTQRGSYEKIYRSMHNHDIDILVGTQMVAKGLDFPLVSLVGVLAADTTLNMPDWQAGERTFQLLTQIVGRAGRRQVQGEAIIQTYTPQSSIIEAAATQDYRSFYEKEICLRRELLYPPFAQLIRLLVVSRDLAKTQRIAKILAEFSRFSFGKESVLGPAAAPWEKIKDHYRWQIILKGQLEKELLSEIWQKIIKQENLKENEVFLQIDVDPLQMM
ncbi:MAG: replication restart helicase PriA [Bacillota bacterium]|jgi:primosomal protein N' (replication factor Y)